MIEVAGDSGPQEIEVGVTRGVPGTLPVLPLRETVPLPDTLMPLAVGQERSVQLITDVLAGDRTIVMVASREPENETPGPAELYGVGVVGSVARMLKVPDGTLRILVQGAQRVRLDEWTQEQPYLVAAVTELPDVVEESPALTALQRNVPAHVLPDRRAGPLPAGGAAGRRRERRAAGRALLPDRGGAAPEDRGEAGAAGGGERRHAAAEPRRAPRARARGRLDRLADPVPGPVGDRQGPARVRPAPAAQGDPGRARRVRRVRRGGRRAPRAAPRQAAARRGAQAGGPGAEPPRAPAARRGRARRHPRPTSSGWPRCRGTAPRRTASTSRTPARCSTRTTTASRRSRSGSSSSSLCAS